MQNTSSNDTKTAPIRSADHLRNHKPSKYTYLGVIFLAILITASFVVRDTVKVFNSVETEIPVDTSIITVAPPTQGDALQPNAAKIGGLDNETFLVQDGTEYLAVWERLDRLGAAYGQKDKTGVVTEKARLHFIISFLDDLNYRVTEPGQPILSKVNGDKVNPETIDCYLNGYVPGKPYLKANCPTY